MKSLIMNRALLLQACLLSGLTPAWAGKISLETQIQLSAPGDILHATVSVTNHGDESAYNVQIKAESLNPPLQSLLQQTLPVGKTFSATFRQSIKNFPPGRYPLLLRILYADANMYPFSAPATSSFIHGQDAVPDLLGIFEHTQIGRNGRLLLKLKNPGELSKRVHIRLFLPQELSAENPAQEIELAPRQETSLRFPVHNFSALEGSTYAVFAVLEYDQGGLHYSTLAPGTVTIGSSGSFGNDWIFGILLVILFTWLIFVNVRPSRKRK
jgi:hypothetical protein